MHLSGRHHAPEELDLHTGTEAMDCDFLAISGGELEHGRLTYCGCDAVNIQAASGAWWEAHVNQLVHRLMLTIYYHSIPGHARDVLLH